MLLAGVARLPRSSLVALAVAAAVSMQVREAWAVQQCKPASVVGGVDLNPSGDGTLGWGASGKGFAVLKATQGDYYTDADFAANWAALKSAGVVRGAYHFFDATVSGAAQASYFLSVVGTIEPGDLPPVLDIECPVAGDANCLGNGSSGAATAAQITQVMNDFLAAVKTATGLTPIVYSYGSWFADNSVDTTGLQNYPLWLADYSGTSCFTVPAPWSAATIWQYDSSGTVSGINVDDDYFLGSAAQLAMFTSQGGLPVDGGADAGSPNYGPCTVTTTGDMGMCIDTTQCVGQGGTSTPNYCPGPANIECCTGVPVHDAGAQDASSEGGGVHDAGSGTDAGGTGEGGVVPGDASTSGDGGVPSAASFGDSGGGCSTAAPGGGPGIAWLGLSALAIVAGLGRRTRSKKR